MKSYKTWPFTVYDFFSFFIPAVLFLSFLCLFLVILSPASNLAFIDNLVKLIPDSTSWVIEMLIFIVAVSLVYVVGHLVAAASSLVFDKLIIARCTGYPYEKLLKIKPDEMEEFKRQCHLLICGLPMSLPIVFIAVSFFSAADRILTALVFVWLLLLLISLCLYTIGRSKGAIRERPLIAMTVKWLSRPFALFPVKVSRLFRFYRPMSGRMRNSIAMRFMECFAMEIRDAGTNAFHLFYDIVESRSGESCMEAIRYARHLYSFARNTAAVFGIFFVLATVTFWRDGNPHMRHFALWMLAGTLIFSLKFYSLYKNYTKRVLHVFLSSFVDNP